MCVGCFQARSGAPSPPQLVRTRLAFFVAPLSGPWGNRATMAHSLHWFQSVRSQGLQLWSEPHSRGGSPRSGNAIWFTAPCLRARRYFDAPWLLEIWEKAIRKGESLWIYAFSWYYLRQRESLPEIIPSPTQWNLTLHL